VEWWGWGWKHGPPDPDLRYIWLALADNANLAGTAFPSIKHLVEKTRRSESTVRRAIERLVSGGWVIRTERGDGRGKRTHYQLVKRVSGGNPLTGETVTEKGCQAEAQTVSQGPEKGVRLTEPPHPHIGVTVKETSENRQGGTVSPKGGGIHPPFAPLLATGKIYGEAELVAASRLFKTLNVPASESLCDLAAQAIHFEARRLGSITEAEASILKAATTAQTAGETRWAFWLQDGGWKQPQRVGISTAGAGFRLC
jgi:hypothetical protein